MKTVFRHRSLFLFGGATLAALASFWTDPDANGLSTLLGGLALIQGVWAVATSNDPEAHGRDLFARAMAGEFGEIAPYVATVR